MKKVYFGFYSGWGVEPANFFLGYIKRVITRFDKTPYLIRYTLLNTPLFSIKIHKILESDDACFHDHPWAFISIILKNGYIEHRRTPIYLGSSEDEDRETYTLLNDHKQKRYRALSILYRPAKWAHRLEIQPGKPATTLVITFKRIRTWGFFTPKGWVFWRNYQQGHSKTCE